MNIVVNVDSSRGSYVNNYPGGNETIVFYTIELEMLKIFVKKCDNMVVNDLTALGFVLPEFSFIPSYPTLLYISIFNIRFFYLQF